MKRAVVFAVFLLLAVSSSSFAVLRPRFPAKTAPPDGGHWLIIQGDDSSKSPLRSSAR